MESSREAMNWRENQKRGRLIRTRGTAVKRASQRNISVDACTSNASGGSCCVTQMGVVSSEDDEEDDSAGLMMEEESSPIKPPRTLPARTRRMGCVTEGAAAAAVADDSEVGDFI
jgi:hypothetical protein